jgi:hypothetical protein
MTKLLTTGQRRQAYKRLLKILAQRDLPRPQAVQKLTNQVKIKQQQNGGAVVEKDPIYKSSSDASDFVKELVEDEEYPIDVDGNFVTRTDIEGETA